MIRTIICDVCGFEDDYDLDPGDKIVVCINCGEVMSIGIEDDEEED